MKIKKNNMVEATSFQGRYFKQPILDLWNIIKDTTVTAKLLSNGTVTSIQLEPIFLKGINSYENNSQYVISINKERVFKVEEIIESDYYCKIKHVVFDKRTNENISSETNSLHYIDEYFTLLIREYKSSPVQTQMMIQSSGKSLKDIQKHYFVQIERGIMNRQYKKTNYVGKKINASFNYVLSFLKNIDIMANVTGTSTIFEAIGYKDNNHNHTGTRKISFLINKQHLGVIKIQIKHTYLQQDSFISHLYLTNENYKFPQREMIVHLHGINDNESFVVYRHNFFEEISQKKLAYISSVATQFLESLNKIVMHFHIKNLKRR